MHQVISTRVQVVSTRVQVISPRVQVISARVQVVSPRVQVVSTREQVVSPRVQVVSPRVQVISPRVQVVSPRERVSTGVRKGACIMRPRRRAGRTHVSYVASPSRTITYTRRQRRQGGRRCMTMVRTRLERPLVTLAPSPFRRFARHARTMSGAMSSASASSQSSQKKRMHGRAYEQLPQRIERGDERARPRLPPVRMASLMHRGGDRVARSASTRWSTCPAPLAF